jgi:hypothetical protein
VSLETPQIDLKVYLSGTTNGSGRSDFDPQALIPVFHRWIQRGELDELMIDVADYSHVPDGATVLLLCHDGQYSLDRRKDGWGLLYSRRRETAQKRRHIKTLPERLRSVFSDAVEVCLKLEEDKDLAGALSFGGDRFLLTVNDRRVGPELAAEMRAALVDLAAELFPGTAVHVELEAGAGDRLAFRIDSEAAPVCAALLDRLRTGELVR